ncbi:thymidylate synthase [bacterium]|nr:thymidylate synthase [bacterium]NCQ54854.1 thymidylate synthase [Candidatus Parcubacteria bacterium]NCS66898.1 thymidylate synthase [Candidatus Peregrinibacteria bacterium]NCS95844.1 thymidylate synthase [bacterium]
MKSENINAFDVQYAQILKEILEHGIEEKNERTGHVCKSLPGMTMKFDLSEGFPLLTLRKIPLKVFIAEQVWFLMGGKNLEWLQQFTKIWDNFAEENNCVESAYGFRWRAHFGRDQIDGLVQLLTDEPTSRHGVILMWDPSDDGLSMGTKKKNVPCPYTFTVQIIGGKLCLHLVIRSNDMMLGNPHDTAGFALLAEFLAEKLGVTPGYLTVSISNAHIYDIHFAQAQEIVERRVVHSPIKFKCPQDAFDRAENGDTKLVTEIFDQFKAEYNPQESLGKMNIVL